MSHSADADCHFAASTVAAIINFPLWRASAIAQSGFELEGSNFVVRYYEAAVKPPFKGLGATIIGMSWARGAIFYGSDVGKSLLTQMGIYGPVAQTLPPLIIGTIVQVVNMPLVRATITIQDPKSEMKNTWAALVYIYKTRGVAGLWHGVSAGILKTVPKYVTAIVVKDLMEEQLPYADCKDKTTQLTRSAIKAVTAGMAGAILTNPLDVIRNEMFKTDLGLINTFNQTLKKEGWAFMTRGMTSNVTAVSVPIAMTIFLTDLFRGIKHDKL